MGTGNPSRRDERKFTADKKEAGRKLPLLGNEPRTHPEVTRCVNRVAELFSEALANERSSTSIVHEDVTALFDLKFDELLRAVEAYGVSEHAAAARIRGFLGHLARCLRVLDGTLHELKDRAGAYVDTSVAGESQRQLLRNPEKPILRLHANYGELYERAAALRADHDALLTEFTQTSAERTEHGADISRLHADLHRLRRQWTEFLSTAQRVLAHDPIADMDEVRALQAKLPGVRSLVSRAERIQADIVAKRSHFDAAAEVMHEHLAQIRGLRKEIESVCSSATLLRNFLLQAGSDPDIVIGEIPGKDAGIFREGLGGLEQILNEEAPSLIDPRLELVHDHILQVEAAANEEAQDAALGEHERELQRLLVCALSVVTKPRSTFGRTAKKLLFFLEETSVLAPEKRPLALDVLEHSATDFTGRPAFFAKRTIMTRYLRQPNIHYVLTRLGEKMAQRWLRTTFTNEQVAALRAVQEGSDVQRGKKEK